MSKYLLIGDMSNSCSECEFKGYKSENAQYTCCDRLDYCIHDNMLENGKFKNCPLQDTSDLLEALEDLSNTKIYMSSGSIIPLNHFEEFKKLQKALGGNKNGNK